MSNRNVLAGIQCPECKSDGPFNIAGTAFFRNVTDDGCDDFTDMEWTDESYIYCMSCKYGDKVHKFSKET